MSILSRQDEEAWLQRVISEVKRQLDDVLGERDLSRRDMRHLRRVFWDDLHTEGAEWGTMAQRIVQLNETGNVLARRSVEANKLELMKRRPYFGRIDFHEEGQLSSEELYIGLGSLIDRENHLPLVYDWRAPISSMYYDYAIGPAAYECADGTIRGRILRKRQYKIEDGKLVFFLENPLTIDDELLQQVLSKNVDDKMRNIVNSIQREQNQAIRYERHPVLIVEGPAGSGKTSVALHRIAYLMYAHRDSIGANNVIILSPNRVFGDYIAGVLPELGEENVLQTTFQDFAESFFGYQYEVQSLGEVLKELYGIRDSAVVASRLAGIRLKSGDDFLALLTRYADQLYAQGDFLTDVYLNGDLVMSQQEMQRLFRESYSYLPLVRRLQKLVRRIKDLLRPIKKRQITARLKVIAASPAGEEMSDWDRKRAAIQPIRQTYQELMAKIQAKLDLDYIQAYRDLFNSTRCQRLAADLNLPPAWQQMGKKTLGKLAKGIVDFEDAAPLLYLKGRLIGFPRREKIRQVVIDEAQDYSPIQLTIIKLLFPNSHFTLLGDNNQSINPLYWEGRKLSVAQPFDDDALGYVRLTKTYRSTQQITQFCQGILGDNIQHEFVVRSGELPIITSVNAANHVHAITSAATTWLDEGYETIAIICSSIHQARQVHAQLKTQLEVKLIANENDPFQKGLLIIPVYLAKGLEFDAVLIWDANEKNYGMPWQRGLLYVACSRALHRLQVCFDGKMSPFLAEIDPKNYRYLSE